MIQINPLSVYFINSFTFEFHDHLNFTNRETDSCVLYIKISMWSDMKKDALLLQSYHGFKKISAIFCGKKRQKIPFSHMIEGSNTHFLVVVLLNYLSEECCFNAVLQKLLILLFKFSTIFKKNPILDRQDRHFVHVCMCFCCYALFEIDILWYDIQLCDDTCC